ncbi:flagellar basal body P-ring biosynthesis protein FlgA [Photobacterium aquae]|uniref:Flagella basal body P-ring formation protein FlgA n=2 Tax=Photobacterium aquae TaxID=1195763 RepID=A0A0J1H2H1_9GAMM|nr:flagellar basal body P-ring biosynthesis protein FlgA [Photobacterium aquae]
MATFFSTFLLAETQDNINDVRKAAELFVSQQIEKPARGELHIEAAALDSRIRLTTCPTPLETNIPGKQSLSGNVTVLVSCPADGWQVYVPVSTKLLLPRVVASRPLARGMTLANSDLTVQMVEVRLQRGVTFDNPTQIIGSKVKRAVQLGDAVMGSDICLVCRNDAVNIKAGNGGLSIITKGSALSDGSLGEQIRVQNSKSRRIVDAIVTDVGEVTVNY